MYELGAKDTQNENISKSNAIESKWFALFTVKAERTEKKNWVKKVN